jgi:hypothetical protein
LPISTIVATTPVENFPPMSTTLGANFDTRTAGVVDIGGKYRLTLLPKDAKKIIKTFLIEIFFQLPLVSVTLVVHLEMRISP